MCFRFWLHWPLINLCSPKKAHPHTHSHTCAIYKTISAAFEIQLRVELGPKTQAYVHIEMIT